MVELKRKVTLKRKSDVVTNTPELKKGNSFLAPLIIIGAIALLIVGYFVFSPGKNESGADSGNTAQNATTDVSPTPQPIPVAAEVKTKEAPSTSNVNQQDKSTVRPSTSPQANAAQAVASKPVVDLPYKKGEAYKVYQFPFGIADYSIPNPELDKLVEVMKQNPSVKISILAYTDNVGDANYNQGLSEKRAKAIRNYLIGKGIEQGRLTSQGKGVSTKYSGNAENRRAEFILS